ncbi:MAG: glycosyltransferase family 2 protein [Mycobacteriales bacterium]
MATISVVVPVHNAEPYLQPCLDSLAAQAASVEVVCVDDGSTDGSEAVLDQYAARHPWLRVLHVANGGAGRARNLGVAAATGEFLAFADADDIVPRGAYDRLLDSVRRTGSDLVVGAVLRVSAGRTWPSGLHSRAILQPEARTHISRTPSLLYDATVWNKLYRRDWWDAHGLRFPEHSTYEDIVPALSAHVLARSVDVLTEPVYLWRLRDDGVPSRSSQRWRLVALEDRLAALDAVDRLLVERGLEDLRLHLQVRLLTMDLPLFLDALPDADPAFRARVAHVVAERLAAADPRALEQVRRWERLVYGLVRRHRWDSAARVYRGRHAARAAAGPAWRLVRRGAGAVRRGRQGHPAAVDEL